MSAQKRQRRKLWQCRLRLERRERADEVRKSKDVQKPGQEKKAFVKGREHRRHAKMGMDQPQTMTAIFCDNGNLDPKRRDTQIRGAEPDGPRLNRQKPLALTQRKPGQNACDEQDLPCQRVEKPPVFQWPRREFDH